VVFSITDVLVVDTFWHRGNRADMIEGCVLNHSELGSQTKDALRSISLVS
jgi:hypothetical protein